MTVVAVTLGGAPAPSDRSMRTTVQLPATGTPLSVLVLPPKALEMNNDAVVGVEVTAMSHGPTMLAFVTVSTGVPVLFKTMRHPTGSGVGRAPPGPVGRLPTTTQ